MPPLMVGGKIGSGNGRGTHPMQHSKWAPRLCAADFLRAAGFLCAAMTSLPLVGCLGEATDGSDDAVRVQALEEGQTLAPKPGSSKDNDYTLFEAGPVRPVAMGPRGIVAVANIPDDRVELFRPGR